MPASNEQNDKVSPSGQGSKNTPQKKQRRRRKRRANSNSEKRKKTTPAHPKIALLGFRGIGKSTIARKIARHWDVQIIHLDQKIEHDEGKSISEIVRESGWKGFRAAETRALRDVIENIEGPVLLDTGGGIIETADAEFSEENSRLLKDNFFSVYLYVDEDKVMRRLSEIRDNKSRPPLDESDLRMVYRRRQPWYQKSAHAVVDISDCSASDAADRIINLLQKH